MLKNIIPFLLLLITFISCSNERTSSDYIRDEVGILSSDEKKTLSSEIQALEKTIGSQLAILIVDSTGSVTLEELSLKTANDWQLGRKDYDDGVLIVIAMSQKQARIEVGKGLEKIIDDKTAESIVYSYIGPAFRREKYFEGLLLGVVKVKQLIQDKPELVGKR